MYAFVPGALGSSQSYSGCAITPVLIETHSLSVAQYQVCQRYPQPIELGSALFDALPRLPALTKVTLVIDETIPTQILIALSQASQLNELEIQQTKLDDIGLCFSQTSFPQLETLTITTKATVRVTKIEREFHNVMLLLQCVSPRLKALKISGDLISSMFLAIFWLRLEGFTVTEHTPSPYYAVPRLISHMPRLRQLEMG
ncbi:hypothetical protein R3P38DRAFT_3220592 [Favolaschia claudopus]|uniref:MutS-like protein n=1 Tax=Favolaschia claudopus TaxID=2862362 RepID=A0AAW0A1Y9_9AGAR